jgi:hypothetical protein
MGIALMELQEWVKKNMGVEYLDELTPAQNITSLVEEVQLFRKLCRELAHFTNFLNRWASEYEDFELDEEVEANDAEEAEAEVIHQ